MNSAAFIDDLEKSLVDLQWLYANRPSTTAKCAEFLADSIYNLRQAISSQRAGAKQEDERQLDLPLN